MRQSRSWTNGPGSSRRKATASYERSPFRTELRVIGVERRRSKLGQASNAALRVARSRTASPLKLPCNVLISTADSTVLSAAAVPKTPAAPSSNCARQAVIWPGWTPYCCASSATVFSPFTAASATLALKPDEWFRRVRFVIVSPDPRHHRRFQAENPFITLSEFPRPALISISHP